MSTIRRFIRHTIIEAMKNVNELPEGYIIMVDIDTNEEIMISIQHGPTAADTGIQPNKPLAVVMIAKPDKSTGPCDDAWVVTLSNAREGWGPLLYDIAIEYATLHGNGLTPDREAVSDDAYRVWNYYFRQRSDVKHHQLDSKRNTLTSIEKDNCVQLSTATHANGKFENELAADDLRNSPLAQRYTKAPTLITKLKKSNKIQFNH